MINFKKLAALGLAAVMGITTLVGCGSNGSSSTQGGNTTGVETKHHKIGVGLYTDSGRAVDAIKAYLEGISSEVDCEFSYVTLSTYDEATNLSEVQNLISSGCEGIILTADMGTTSILQECTSAGVYIAGFLCDYNTSYTTAYDDVFGSEYFLGTVCDGWQDSSQYGIDVANSIIENGYKNVGVITFPSWAYPNQADTDKAFRATIEEYNKTAEEPITLVDTVELQFAPLEDTYLSEHKDIDCIFSLAAGANFVYPVIVAAGRTDIALYTTGFEATDDVENFGSAGNGVFKGIMCSAPEAIVYPLCLLIDQLNGTTYADLPEKSERVDCTPYEVISDEDMEQMKTKLYFTADYKDAVITGADIVNMCASYNSDATYAALVEKLQGLGL